MTAENLKSYGSKLRERRIEEVKTVLEAWLNSFVEKKHRPWKAVIGNKKCKPIPIHRDVYFVNHEYRLSYTLYWPDLPEKMIIEIIESLGFVVSGPHLCLSVPAYEKGKPLTFAQEKVKYINDCYSRYILKTRQEARAYYQEVLGLLFSMPEEQISSFDEYTLYRDFKFSTPISRDCCHYLNLYLSRNGIQQLFDETGNYLGMQVFDATNKV